MEQKPELPEELLDAAVELMSRAAGGGTVRVKGRSMLPTLHEGQILAVEFSPRRLSRGDLLLYRQQDYLVVHRLLGPGRPEDGGPRWRTRGDGTIGLDPPLDPQRIVGRVVAIRDGDVWRGMRSGGARFYGWALAWHGLSWAAAGAFFRRVDGKLGRWGLRTTFRDWAERIDRTKLRLVHGLLFRLLHRPTAPPEATAEVSSPAGDGGGAG